MGALFGFSGPPDEALRRRMADVLAHRAGADPVCVETPEATLCYAARFDPATSDGLGAGIHTDGDQTLAVAGLLTHDRPTPPILPLLLDRYRDHGLDALCRLHGAFVLAVRDRDTIHLVRDGAGARTLYYGCHQGRFLFAVEPKGVTVAPGFPRRIRPEAVAQYLTFSFTPGAGTMLADLYEVPPGHVVSWAGRPPPRVRRYFVFEDQDKQDGAPAVWVRRFRRTFRRAVADRIPTDRPVGLFLSGGIDSSVVAAELVRQGVDRLKTYAIHFGPDYPHELEYARAVAQRLGTDHEEVLIRARDFLPRLRRMVWHLDEPIGDPITMPNFELSAHAARSVRWVFNGEGGDPVFGGPKNLPLLLGHWYGGIERDARFRERLYLASYRRGYDDLERMLTPAWRARYDPAEALEGVLTPFFTADRPTHLLDKLMAINIRLKGAHLILPKVERMTGAWGLVPPSPLFDERLIRLSFQMPTTMKLAGGVEKLILKRAYRRMLPRAVIQRPKSGMRVPVHYWFQGELKRYARKILHPRVLRREGIFDPEHVRRILAYNTDGGPGRYGLRLWMLLTFEIWRRIVVEGEAV